MKQYSVKIKFPINGVIRILEGGSESLRKTLTIEAEDEEAVKDEVLFAAFINPMTPTYASGTKIVPIIMSIDEVID